MKKIKCAVIGCGRIGCGFNDKSKKIRTHAKAYTKNQNTELTALCDIDKEKIIKYAKKFNVKNTFIETKKMYSELNLNCISICTLVETHLALVEEASKNKIQGILLEKPISNNLRDAKKIIQICNKKKIKLLINHQRRFDPFYHTLRKFLQTKILGDVQIINIYYGGGISNTGSHIFDILRLLIGEVKSVRAHYSKNKSQNNMDPNLDLDLEFKNGIICKFHALDLRNYGICEMDMFTIMGRIKLNLITNEIQLFKISLDKYQDYKKLTETDVKIKKSKYAFDISLGIKNLIECVKKSKSPLCSGYDGYMSLELIVASMISAEQDKRITLPIKNREYTIHSR